MKPRTDGKHRHEPTEADIQHAAYLLWIAQGRPENCALDNWLAARELLIHQHGRDAKTGRPARPGVSQSAAA